MMFIMKIREEYILEILIIRFKNWLLLACFPKRWNIIFVSYFVCQRGALFWQNTNYKRFENKRWFCYVSTCGPRGVSAITFYVRVGTTEDRESIETGHFSRLQQDDSEVRRGVPPRIHDFGTTTWRWDLATSSPRNKNPIPNWTGGWVGPWLSLEAVLKMSARLPQPGIKSWFSDRSDRG